MSTRVDGWREGIRHRRRGPLVGAALAAGTILSLAGAAPAIAGVQQEFEVFKECPVNAPGAATCVYSTTTTGEFHLGSKTVPVTKTVVLQGALSTSSPVLIPAANGETLSKTSLPVPGGLTGLGILGNLEEVYATAEPAGPVEVNTGAFGKQEGTAVAMPLKVHLENPALGATCFVGSDAEPVSLKLTTGTTSPPAPNKPISGSKGELYIHAGAGKIAEFRNNALVDNSFAAPGVSGCDEPLSAAVDVAVDADTGLPAAAGSNAAVLSGTLQSAGTEIVKRELELPELGRCVKVAGERFGHEEIYHGDYYEKDCTLGSTSDPSGEYEWYPGPGAGNKFTATGRTVTLETVAGKRVTCTGSSSTGEYTGTKTATLGITLTGCGRTTLSKETCQSAGAGSGEIVASGLSAELGFIKDTALPGSGEVEASLGWDLTKSPTVLAGECGPGNEALVVTGSVIAPISAIDKMAPNYTLKYTEKTGNQIPESFEGKPQDTLGVAFGSGASQGAGLTSTVKVANEEKLEFKALAE